MSKKGQNFSSLDSLKPVESVINEAAEAVKDEKRTIDTSSIPEVLAGAIGAGAGAGIGFLALYGAGIVGLSAAGITSGLAAAGAIVGGGMAAGVFVLAAPAVLLAAGGVGIAAHLKNKKLSQQKELLYKEALLKLNAIIDELNSDAEKSKERMDYLQSLNILLNKAVKDLAKDLNRNSEKDFEKISA